MTAPTIGPEERRLREQLGITDPDVTVIIIGQTSHNDWDWFYTFEEFYGLSDSDPVLGPTDSDCTTDGYNFYGGQSVANVFDALFVDGGLLHQPGYRYSICEMSFLERYLRGHQDLFDRPAGDDVVDANLNVSGGGMTSPSSLLSCGEAFIRNYLLGWLFAEQNLPAYAPGGRSIEDLWLSDDFGLETQLPALAEAMGVRGVAFSRIGDGPPAYGMGAQWTPDGFYAPNPGSPASQLLADGIDFRWAADDGAEVFAHWLVGMYSQLRNDGALTNLQTGSAGIDAIGDAFRWNLAAQGADQQRYVYVPYSNDMMTPDPGLVATVSKWTEPGTTVVVGTYDDYAALVRAHWAHNGEPAARTFTSTPVIEGMVASCPAIKIAHRAATHTLVGAEVFGAVAASLGVVLEDHDHEIVEGWRRLVPSTHHAYVTGLADCRVYKLEQVPFLLREGDEPLAVTSYATADNPHLLPGPGALPRAFRARVRAIDAIAARLPRAHGDRAVFNQLGFEVGQVAQVDDEAWTWATAPSCGYAMGRSEMAPAPACWLSPPRDVPPALGSYGAESVAFGNGLVAVTLEQGPAGWYLGEFRAEDGPNVLSGPANVLGNYAEYQAGNPPPQPPHGSSGDPCGCGSPWGDHSLQGNGFQFLYEQLANRCRDPFELGDMGEVTDVSATITAIDDLRVGVETSVTFGSRGTFTQAYELRAGEPYLRMATIGQAAFRESVMVRFPLRADVASFAHGTSYHWHRQPARPDWAAFDGWHGPFFKPTFDYVIAEAGDGAQLATFYDKGGPAWGAQGNTMYGCLLRNTVMGSFGSQGVDPGCHTIEYALRLPGVGAPETGAPLRESLAYQVPLVVKTLAGEAADPVAPRFSLAAPSDDRAIVTAAKRASRVAADLVLRIYQPTNGELPVEVATDVATATPSVEAITALEKPITNPNVPDIGIAPTPGAFSFTAHRSLTTVTLKDVFAG